MQDLIFFGDFDMICPVTVMRERVICQVKTDSEPEKVEARQEAGERHSQTAGGTARQRVK